MVDPYRMIEISAEAEFERISKEQEELIASIEKSLENRKSKENPFVFAGKEVILDGSSSRDDAESDEEEDNPRNSRQEVASQSWFDD